MTTKALVGLETMRDQMLSVLRVAQGERPKRDTYVEITNAWGQSEKVPEWAMYEMNVMLNEVNLRRKKAELSVIKFDNIMKADSQACGHSDYSSKFALYCAELALKADVV